MNGQHPGGEERGRTDDERLLTLLRELIQTEGLPGDGGAAGRERPHPAADHRVGPAHRARARRPQAALAVRRKRPAHPSEEEASGELVQRLDRLEDRVEALADELRAALDRRPSPSSVKAPLWRCPLWKSRPQASRGGPIPNLITTAPEDGEELAYGEAMPAILAWRQARAEYREARRRLDRLDAERRLWELEIVLIRDHELTLPPASYPWDQFDRRDEVWGLERALADLRGERRRAVVLLWLRRVLTLGLWWK